MREDTINYCPYCGKKVEVVDTTGAGDAFFSTVLTRLDQNGFNYSSLEEILKEAVEVSASICLKKGALLQFRKDVT